MSESNNHVFGKIPTAATHWKLQSPGDGEKWTILLAQSGDGADAKVSTFPLALLTVENIRESWGPGTYRTIWFGDNNKGGLIRMGMGRIFEVEAARNAAEHSPVAPPPPAPPPAPVVAAPVNEAMNMIQMANLLAKDQIAMVQLMSAQALQQQQMMAAQQIAFLQESAKATTHQMSAHYAAMMKTQRANDAPPAWAQQLAKRVDELEYEPEPDAAEAALATTTGEPAPFGGIVTPKGELSIPHVIQALVQQGAGPQVLGILQGLVDKGKAMTTPPATPGN